MRNCACHVAPLVIIGHACFALAVRAPISMIDCRLLGEASSDLLIDVDVEGDALPSGFIICETAGVRVMDVMLRVLQSSFRGALSHRGHTTASTSGPLLALDGSYIPRGLHESVSSIDDCADFSTWICS